jgi:hypothetical protein
MHWLFVQVQRLDGGIVGRVVVVVVGGKVLVVVVCAATGAPAARNATRRSARHLAAMDLICSQLASTRCATSLTGRLRARRQKSHSPLDESASLPERVSPML